MPWGCGSASATTTSGRWRATAPRWRLWLRTAEPPEPERPERPLTILTVAYPLAPVRADVSGGAEQVARLLDAGLVSRGHRSVVIAREGSQVVGSLIEISGAAEDYADRDRAQRAHAAAIGRALADTDVDLVHMHGLDYHAYLPPPQAPVLATLHLPISWYPAETLAPQRPRTHINCVSRVQARTCPASAPLAGTIENGVRLEEFQARGRSRGYLLALGRICPEKGFHLALQAAERSGWPLLLAGAVFPYESHRRYFREEVAPRLARDRRYLGPVGFARKRRLLAGAAALLVPSLVEETSSLAAMEALASGTPVIAFRSGALAEIVDHGSTGYLCDDLADMVRAIGKLSELDLAACRRAAERRFSADRMVEEYVALYRAILARERQEAPAAAS